MGEGILCCCQICNGLDLKFSYNGNYPKENRIDKNPDWNVFLNMSVFA